MFEPGDASCGFVERTDEIRLGGNLGIDHGHGDLSTQGRLIGPVHHLVRTLSDELPQLVAADRPSGLQGLQPGWFRLGVQVCAKWRLVEEDRLL